jgi:Flp pilus assembly protein TadD
VSAFQQCLKLVPKDARAEDNLGLAYQGLNRIPDAITAFQTAIEWQKASPLQNPEPFIDLGALLLDQNRPKEAVSYLLQALAISPEAYRSQGMAELEPRVHEHLAKAYSRLNEMARAQTELEKAVALSPNDAHLHYLLGQVYRREGLADKAKAELDHYTAMADAQNTTGRADR